MKPSLAVVILTHNEEKHLSRAIKSVRDIASTIHVIDSGSNDRTLDIAVAFGVDILHHKWKNYADQFQWALDNIQTNADWILRLDADEVIEHDLAERLRSDLPNLPSHVVGINIDRKHIFMGRWIRHGGRYPLTLLRIFRRGCGRIEQRWMDEHVVVEGGTSVHFKGGFADINLNDLGFFIEKHNKYATREAVDVLGKHYSLFDLSDRLLPAKTSWQAAIKRWVKINIYNQVPFPIAAFSYFFFRYIVQLGFLDGREGFIYHFLQGYWYRFLVGAKLMELDRAIRHLPDKDQKKRALADLTGLQLD